MRGDRWSSPIIMLAAVLLRSRPCGGFANPIVTSGSSPLPYSLGHRRSGDWERAASTPRPLPPDTLPALPFAVCDPPPSAPDSLTTVIHQDSPAEEDAKGRLIPEPASIVLLTTGLVGPPGPAGLRPNSALPLPDRPTPPTLRPSLPHHTSVATVAVGPLGSHGLQRWRNFRWDLLTRQLSRPMIEPIPAILNRDHHATASDLERRGPADRAPGSHLISVAPACTINLACIQSASGQ